MISGSSTRRAKQFTRKVKLAVTLAFASSAFAMLPARTVYAQEQEPSTEARATARELALQGAKAFDSGEWAQALELFNRAYALYPAPTISIMQARTLARLGRLLESVDTYELTMRAKLDADASDAFKQAVSDAASEVETVRVRLPRVKIVVAGAFADSANLNVIVDGKSSPQALLGVDRPIDPGKHSFTVETPEGAKGSRELLVEEGRSYTVEITLEAPKAAPPPPRVEPAPVRPVERKPNRTPAYIAFGIGGAGLAFGAVTGIIALGKHGDLKDACTFPNDGCPSSSSDDLDSFHLNRTLSLVGFGVGAAGIIGGTVLLLTAPKSESSAELRAYITPSSAGLRGSF